MKAPLFRLVATTAILLGSVYPAHADWDPTQWGMSPDEALAVLDHAVSHDPAPGEFYLDDGTSYGPLVKLPHEIDGIAGQVSLLFDSDDRLQFVLFNPVDIAECDALQEAMTARHGTPDALEPGFVTISDWVEGADTIKLTNMAAGGICNLSDAPA